MPRHPLVRGVAGHEAVIHRLPGRIDDDVEDDEPLDHLVEEQPVLLLACPQCFLRPLALADVTNDPDDAVPALHLQRRGREGAGERVPALPPHDGLHLLDEPALHQLFVHPQPVVVIDPQADLLGGVIERLVPRVPEHAFEGRIDFEDDAVGERADVTGVNAREEGGLEFLLALVERLQAALAVGDVANGRGEAGGGPVGVADDEGPQFDRKDGAVFSAVFLFVWL